MFQRVFRYAVYERMKGDVSGIVGDVSKGICAQNRIVNGQSFQYLESGITARSV